MCYFHVWYGNDSAAPTELDFFDDLTDYINMQKSPATQMDFENHANISSRTTLDSRRARQAATSLGV